MKREPLTFYLLRLLMGITILLCMLFLYWSSNLIEQDMKQVQRDVETIKNELFNLSREQLQWQQKLNESSNSSNKKKNEDERSEPFSQIDPSLENLLEPDIFYEETLPSLLGANFQPNGSLRSASVGKPAHLHPFSNWSQVASWNNQCTVTCARQQFGKYETMAPYMALKIEARKREEQDIYDFWVHLRDDVYWQPLETRFFPEDLQLNSHFLQKHRVTAHDFKFYFDALMNPFVQEGGAVSLRTYLGDIEEIKVIDDLTFVVRWKTELITENGKKVPKVKYVAKLLTGQLKPLASFVFQYFTDGTKILEDDSDSEIYRTSSVWANNFNQHWARHVIVSCGPWIFDGINDREIKFRRNPDHFFPLDALVEKQINTFRNTQDAIWNDFKTGKIDAYSLAPDQLGEYNDFLLSEFYSKQIEDKFSIQSLEYLSRSYAYIGWNQKNPLFANKMVRQALTMAIDRERIIDQNLNGLGIPISGPFFRYSSAYDSKILPWPFDPFRSKRKLEELGFYDSDANSEIDKTIDGKKYPFSFTLTYYVKNLQTKAICDYIKTALQEIDISCNLNGVDISDLSLAFDDKGFDAIYLGWALGTPPEDPKQLWYSNGTDEKGSSNAVGFSNSDADKIIDRLQYEYQPEVRQELYHKFHAIIHEEAPYTFLYTPKTLFLYREHLQNVFIPADRQDLVPGANVTEPVSSIFWIKR